MGSPSTDDDRCHVRRAKPLQDSLQIGSRARLTNVTCRSSAKRRHTDNAGVDNLHHCRAGGFAFPHCTRAAPAHQRNDQAKSGTKPSSHDHSAKDKFGCGRPIDQSGCSPSRSRPSALKNPSSALPTPGGAGPLCCQKEAGNRLAGRWVITRWAHSPDARAHIDFPLIIRIAEHAEFHGVDGLAATPLAHWTSKQPPTPSRRLFRPRNNLQR
jgi:hypothetical protein